jgi:molybdate transport system ATP-binding protein
MVFNDGVLFPHLSALDNVAFGLPRGNKGAAREWIDRVGLTGHEHLKPEQLSAGLRQRVALARALAPQPRLLLLDEPLAAVDLASRPGLRRLLTDVLAQLDATCLLVTHDPVDARALAHRIVVLEDGVVVQEGSPSDLTAHPRSEWVAEMVGLNVLPAGFAIGAAEGPAVVEPKAVLLSRVRPETSARNVWAGRVNGVDREGERVRVSIRLDAGHDLVAEVTPAAVDDLALAPGTEVWALVKASEVKGLNG